MKYRRWQTRLRKKRKGREEKMIEIKTLFSDWHEVTAEQARAYVNSFLSMAPGMTYTQKIDYLNENRLRGCTVAELMEGA